MTPGTRRLTSYRWVIISFIGFVASLISLFLIVYFIGSGPLAKFSGILFYIILIPFGLVTSGFLFGALKSFAKASGKNIHGTLELGGPVVMFVLLIYGGIYFQKNFNQPTTYNLHLYFYGDEQKAKKIADGKVRIITSGTPTTRTINGEGFISLTLSSEMRGDRIIVDPYVEGYKQNQLQKEIPEGSDVLDIILEPENYLTSVSGYILTKDGQIAQGEYSLEWAGVKVPVDANGRYTLDLPYQVGTVKNLKIFQGSNLVYNIDQAIQESPFDIKLRK